MLRNKAFKQNTDRYDDWFDINSNAYASEIKAFEKLNITGEAIEIGIGTGKFALPLGISKGIEPTKEMYEKAVANGLSVAEGIAEVLPLKSGTFDWVLMVTTICFVNDPHKSAAEMHRILKKGGRCAIGLVDLASPLGAKYLAKKDKSDFYKEAIFYSSEDVISILTKAGFSDFIIWQTLKDTSMQHVEEPSEGHGEGGFVVISGLKG